MIKHATEIRVRYAETDQMGIVYHGNYFTWLEVGRIRLLEYIGLPYTQVEASGYKLPVLEAHLNYHAPARFDETVNILTLIDQPPAARLGIRYQLFREETLLAEGHTVHAFLNASNRPARPPAEFQAIMSRYFPDKI